MEKYDVQVEKKSMDVVSVNTRNVSQQDLKDNSIVIYAQEGTFRMSDKEIRKECYCNKVGVLYGTKDCAHSMKHINDLFAAVKRDYPGIKEKDVYIWSVNNTESVRHAGFTMLWVLIPVEDFIKLRKERKIFIL